MELPVHLHRPSAPPQACLWPSLRPPSIAQTLFLLSQPSNLAPIRARSFYFSPFAYLDSAKSLGNLFNKVCGSLPIIGLVSRILSDEGGVGGDRVQPIEFCTRIYRSCSSEQTNAFYEFEERHGTVASTQYVMIWCWAAALGAGLLKTEDLMLGATRLRFSFDIKYEEENFNNLMDEAAEKRRLSKSTIPFVPYEVRAAKALDAICKCCIGKSSIDEKDARLLTLMLQAVFPGADQEEIERLVRDKVTLAVHDSSIKKPAQISGKMMQASVKTKEVSGPNPTKTHITERSIEERDQAVDDVTQHEDRAQSLYSSSSN